MTRRMIPLMLTIGVLFGACGEGAEVGSRELLSGWKEEEQKRLGEAEPAPDATLAPLDPTRQATPPPVETPPPTPAPAVVYFDIEMVTNSPYYRWQDQEGRWHSGQVFAMSHQAVLRVTNRDTLPERACRSFTEKNGRFNSGCLRPGGDWTFKFGETGRFDIIDEGLTFAVGTLEVQ